MTLELVGIDGAKFPVLDEGSGPPMLILHPGSSDAASWDRVARRLTSRFRVLRFERFTYRSDPTPAAADAMKGEVSDVVAVAEAVDEPVLVVGHSSGGVVALESALVAGSRVAGLVLYEPPVAVTEPLGGAALREARAALDAGDPDQAMTVFLRDIVAVPPLVVSLLRLVPPLWRRQRGYVRAQVADTEAIETLGVGLGRYAALDVPALLVGGGLLSPSKLRGRLEALATALPRADSMVIVKRGGHGMHLSAPGTLSRTIADFADRVTR